MPRYRDEDGFGTGLGICVAIRRKCHDSSEYLYNKFIERIKTIRNTKRGISIVCYLENDRFEYVFEHFDIWRAANAEEKLKEYFDQKSFRSLRQLKQGRLRDMIYYIYRNEYHQRNGASNSNGLIDSGSVLKNSGRYDGGKKYGDGVVPYPTELPYEYRKNSGCIRWGTLVNSNPAKYVQKVTGQKADHRGWDIYVQFRGVTPIAG